MLHSSGSVSTTKAIEVASWISGYHAYKELWSIEISGKASPTFGHENAFFWVYRSYKESISKEMNNDNDLKLHSMTKLPGWLRY